MGVKSNPYKKPYLKKNPYKKEVSEYDWDKLIDTHTRKVRKWRAIEGAHSYVKSKSKGSLEATAKRKQYVRNLTILNSKKYGYKHVINSRR